MPVLAARGARVIWRCHIGADAPNADSAAGWRFLAPYLAAAPACVFSRAAYAPPIIDAARVHVIPPSIDPFSPKNQPLGDEVVRAILAYTGIVAGQREGPTVFAREDGTPGRVDRVAEILRDGPPPPLGAPLVAQVSRWDRLKDPVGVLAGFARLGESDAHLVLAGPNVAGVVDDPEGCTVYAATVEVWRALPPAVRRRCHLVSLPTDDVGENAAIVNALQRHASGDRAEEPVRGVRPHRRRGDVEGAPGGGQRGRRHPRSESTTASRACSSTIRATSARSRRRSGGSWPIRCWGRRWAKPATIASSSATSASTRSCASARSSRRSTKRRPRRRSRGPAPA